MATNQTSIVTLYFKEKDRVRLNAAFFPTSIHAVLDRCLGHVVSEAASRPGYYYVRFDGSPADYGPNPLVCVPWHMLELVDVSG